jgi:hypothetical protein
MSVLNKLLIAGAMVAFVLAVVAAYAGTIAGVSPEGFSRACTNLALLAIALSVAPGGLKSKPPAG